MYQCDTREIVPDNNGADMFQYYEPSGTPGSLV